MSLFRFEPVHAHLHEVVVPGAATLGIDGLGETSPEFSLRSENRVPIGGTTRVRILDERGGLARLSIAQVLGCDPEGDSRFRVTLRWVEDHQEAPVRKPPEATRVDESYPPAPSSRPAGGLRATLVWRGERLRQAVDPDLGLADALGIIPVEIPADARPGDELELRLRLPGDEEPSTLHGEVVRTADGLAFSASPAETTLVARLRSVFEGGRPTLSSRPSPRCLLVVGARRLLGRVADLDDAGAFVVGPESLPVGTSAILCYPHEGRQRTHVACHVIASAGKNLHLRFGRARTPSVLRLLEQIGPGPFEVPGVGVPRRAPPSSSRPAGSRPREEAVASGPVASGPVVSGPVASGPAASGAAASGPAGRSRPPSSHFGDESATATGPAMFRLRQPPPSSALPTRPRDDAEPPTLRREPDAPIRSTLVQGPGSAPPPSYDSGPRAAVERAGMSVNAGGDGDSSRSASPWRRPPEASAPNHRAPTTRLPSDFHGERWSRLQVQIDGETYRGLHYPLPNGGEGLGIKRVGLPRLDAQEGRHIREAVLDARGVDFVVLEAGATEMSVLARLPDPGPLDVAETRVILRQYARAVRPLIERNVRRVFVAGLGPALSDTRQIGMELAAEWEKAGGETATDAWILRHAIVLLSGSFEALGEVTVKAAMRDDALRRRGMERIASRRGSDAPPSSHRPDEG